MPLSDESMDRESSTTLVYGDDKHDGRWQAQSTAKAPCHNPSLLPKRPWYLSATESILRRVGWSSTTADGYALLKSTGDDTVEMKPVFNADKGSPYTSDLPFDTGSIMTLQPIHDAVPYHLAFYHLNYARRRLDPKVKLAFIPEISCQGTSVIKSTTHRDMPCNWSSRIYFDNGTFLQKQELMYTMDARHAFWPSITVRLCSHESVRLGQIRVRDNDGLIAVSMGLRWSSSNGSSQNDLHICEKCYSDLGYHVEVVGREVHYDWENRLSRYDKPSTHKTYGQVLQTAKGLNRPNLHLVTYMTKGGEFSPVKV
ncbi:hypothetical protein PG994_002104 [Apiospora phragmitis]|uniref:Uncharacterized protein n=1 Tax=Apiospora phragmitis TaxID=2905665 RepID=A0ABR1WVD7_9PEZI